MTPTTTPAHPPATDHRLTAGRDDERAASPGPPAVQPSTSVPWWGPLGPPEALVRWLAARGHGPRVT